MRTLQMTTRTVQNLQQVRNIRYKKDYTLWSCKNRKILTFPLRGFDTHLFSLGLPQFSAVVVVVHRCAQVNPGGHVLEGVELEFRVFKQIKHVDGLDSMKRTRGEQLTNFFLSALSGCARLKGDIFDVTRRANTTG